MPSPKHHADAFSYRALRDGLIQTKGASRPRVGSLVTAAGQRRALARKSTVGGSWTPLGPAPITVPPSQPYAWTQDSGRVLSLAYAPTTPGIVYAGSADGGVWKTVDMGATWTPLTDMMPTLSIGALAVDPNNPTTVYAGTGEPPDAVDALYGLGIFKSVNSGQNWTQYGYPLFSQQAISAIQVDPTNSSRVYAGVVNKCGVSPTPSCVPGGNLGVAVSVDGGVNWSEPAATMLTGHNITDLAIDSAGNLYAAVGSPGGAADAASGVYYSNDHGGTWTLASPAVATGTSNWKLAIAPSTIHNPRATQIVYAVAGDNSGTASQGKVLGVWRSADGGATWSQVATTTNLKDCGNQAWYDLFLVVDPASSNTLYVGLTDIFKSKDGGATWANVTNVYANCPPGGPLGAAHGDQHAALFVPGGTVLLAGNDGGVYKTSDGGGTFTSANGNLALSQFYGGDQSRTTPLTIFGGLQDNGGVLTKDGGTTWNEAVPGDGFYSLIDFNNSLNMYGEQERGRTYRTTDGGLNFGYTCDTMPCQTSNMFADPTLFAAPLAMDPSSSLTLLSGRSNLWKTIDGGSTWSMITAPTSSLGLVNTVCGTSSAASGLDCISAIAIAPSSPSTIYIADPQASIWVTTNGGALWTPLNGSGSCSPSNQSPFACAPVGVTGLAVDPTNSSIVYASANAFSTDGTQRYHVFRSADQGTTWVDISTTLPNEPFQSVVVSPTTPTTIFAGADAGVYVSMNSGTTWSVLGSGLPNAAVYQMEADHAGANLIAFTHGRGIWRIPISAAVAPTVTSVSPGQGPAAGGNTVAIAGTGFATAPGATMVAFGANAATGVSCSSTTSCTAKAPAGTGIVDVRVTVASLTSPPNPPADQYYYPGLLRVVTSPAVASQITVDGNIADTWGLDWLEIAPGSHTVCFTPREGFTTPACQTVAVTSGTTTAVTGTFVQRGFLHVFTSPALPSTISVDGIPRDDWGVFTDLPTGSHQVCFGLVKDFTPPACQTAIVTAGATTNITGTFTSSPGASGQTGVGLLRVVTSPAVASQITVDGNIADTWGLDWLEIATGSHTVCFTPREGFTTPACQTVAVTSGVTTAVTGTFVQRGFLHVFTSPASPGTVFINGIPSDDWGVFTDLPSASYQVCFGAVLGFANTPACQSAVVAAGSTTTITGTYS
jgi:hypothetical protein